ncbi:hypothetical protein EXIGLDRAFT_696155 [Exidia glandulosa HHB12029]|uniref:FYVE-type domain-containing protein n=1 Tax=Exidia glandulosa HHB12029 TaxID=1314781 RepID=A0A165FJ07_EXIGL|nr:hypothetical protein EXIGLDRAFT_696155 [Exidia glandulosa HHB12029]
MSLSAAIRAYDALHSTPASDAGSLSPSPSTSTLDSIQEDHTLYRAQRHHRSRGPYAAGTFSNSHAGSSTSSLRACIGLPEPQPLRKHEHLAVLIDRSLWKSDKEARQCDVWNCDTVFSLFERRHHCRKCGGVFCAAHSARTTSLLDTSRLDIFHPPRGQPITDFVSPRSPVVLDARVCDSCHDLLHGIPTWPAASSPVEPATPTSTLPPPSPVRVRRRAHSPHSRSSASTSPLASTPPDGEAPMPAIPGVHRPVRRHSTAPPPLGASTISVRPARSNTVAFFAVPVTSEPPKPAPADMLTAYPLHEHSSACKRRASDRRRLFQQRGAAPV